MNKLKDYQSGEFTMKTKDVADKAQVLKEQQETQDIQE